MSELSPVFIGGTGRSGTTILRRALARHPGLAALDREMRIVVDPGGLLDLASAMTDRWSPYHADRAIRDFEELAAACEKAPALSRRASRLARKLGGSGRRYADIAIGTAVGPGRYRDAVGALVSSMSIGSSRGSWVGSPAFRLRSRIYETQPLTADQASRRIGEFTDALFAGDGVTHWVDDTPTTICHVVAISKVFPGARFVHAHRDPRDVVASFRKTLWGGHDVATISLRVASIYRLWLQQRAMMPAESCIEVRLEDLVSEPAKALRVLCEFIGLDPDDLPADATAFIASGAANVGRYRRQLGRADREIVETELGFVLDEYGYRD